MFIDRLLDRWGYVSDYDYHECLQSNFGSMNQLHDLLKDSTKFNIDNIAEYWGSNPLRYLQFKDFPNVKSPYEKSWYEYSLSDAKSYGLSKIGVFTWSVDSNDGDKQGTTVISFAQRSDGLMAIRDRVLFWDCDYYGNLESFTDFKDTNEDDVFNSPEMISAIPVWLAISFMHCKNVTVNSDEPPAKLQKARERRGKLPLFTFKTLEIKPMVKILKEQGESETKGLKHALHICRGHFKDFTKGPGLGRGHAKGLYWWDSHVRGSREVGAVIKDYKVTPGGER